MRGASPEGGKVRKPQGCETCKFGKIEIEKTYLYWSIFMRIGLMNPEENGSCKWINCINKQADYKWFDIEEKDIDYGRNCKQYKKGVPLIIHTVKKEYID